FWTDRSWALNRLYYQFFSFATKPDPIYPKAIRYLILTALPFAFIGSVPARALLYGLQTREYFLLAFILLGFWLFNAILWKRRLPHGYGFSRDASMPVCQYACVPGRVSVAAATEALLYPQLLARTLASSGRHGDQIKLAERSPWRPFRLPTGNFLPTSAFVLQ